MHGTTFVFLVDQIVTIEIVARASAAQGSPSTEVFDSLHQERLQHFRLAVDDLDTGCASSPITTSSSSAGPMDVPVIVRWIDLITHNIGTVIELSQIAAAANRPSTVR